MTSETDKEAEDQHDFFNTGFLTRWVAQNAVHINGEDSFASNKELFCTRTELFYIQRAILHTKSYSTHKELFYTQRRTYSAKKDLFYTQTKSYSTHKELLIPHTKRY